MPPSRPTRRWILVISLIHSPIGTVLSLQTSTSCRTKAFTPRIGLPLPQRLVHHRFPSPHPFDPELTSSPGAFLSLTILQLSSRDEISPRNTDNLVPDDLGLEIPRASVEDTMGDISKEVMMEIEEGTPSEWMAMKSILGINIFTYALVVLIAFFLSMKAIFGPGWLGQFLGWENVGTFTRVSESLPLTMDVSGDEFLL